MKAVVLAAVLALVAVVSAQSFEEQQYQLRLKDYEEKKAIYDRHQSIANVPVKASNDLVVKVPVDQIPPGYAEQLLPTYTGMPVMFNAFDGPVVEPEIVAETPTVRQATPLRPGPQTLFDKQPAGSSVVVKTTVRAPAPPAPPAQRAPVRRPPNLLLFSNARVSFPNIAQRLGLIPSAPVPNRLKVQAAVSR